MFTVLDTTQEKRVSKNMNRIYRAPNAASDTGGITNAPQLAGNGKQTQLSSGSRRGPVVTSASLPDTVSGRGQSLLQRREKVGRDDL